MPTPLHTPRVNNNDDTVRLVKLLVKPGDSVHAGQLVAEVETDKANFTVESDRDGYVLTVEKSLNDAIDVGSVLLWIGTSADEAAPIATAAISKAPAEPTLKAAQLLATHGLKASDVPASGERLSIADVERFLSSRNLSNPTNLSNPSIAEGVAKPLTPEERGMLRTVSWQRDEAVPGYVELAYDVAAWERAAADYQRRESLLLSPLLALMAHRLARVAAGNPKLEFHDRRREPARVRRGESGIHCAERLDAVSRRRPQRGRARLP